MRKKVLLLSLFLLLAAFLCACGDTGDEADSFLKPKTAHIELDCPTPVLGCTSLDYDAAVYLNDEPVAYGVIWYDLSIYIDENTPAIVEDEDVFEADVPYRLQLVVDVPQNIPERRIRIDGDYGDGIFVSSEYDKDNAQVTITLDYYAVFDGEYWDTDVEMILPNPDYPTLYYIGAHITVNGEKLQLINVSWDGIDINSTIPAGEQTVHITFFGPLELDSYEDMSIAPHLAINEVSKGFTPVGIEMIDRNVWEVTLTADVGSTKIIDHEHIFMKTHPASVGSTCGHPGYVIYTCEVDGCNGQKAEAQEMWPEHTYSDVYDPSRSTLPNCTYPGVLVYPCLYCDAVREEKVQNGDHVYEVISATQPTCTEGAVAHVICTLCGHEDYQDIPPLGHDRVVISSVSPTCEKDGLLNLYCRRCQLYYTETVPALGHEISLWTPNTKDGHDGLCQRCGVVYTEHHIAAQCYSKSEIQHYAVCSVCGGVWDEAHTYDANGVCTQCGHKFLGLPEDLPEDLAKLRETATDLPNHIDEAPGVITNIVDDIIDIANQSENK